MASEVVCAGRPKAPTFASLYGGRRRSNSASCFCRITGKSRSMDEHHYVFSADDFPKFDRLLGCRITEKHDPFKDYKYLYPVLDVDGVTRMVTEHDFHCRITAKYRAVAGHRYVYPVLGARTDHSARDMVSVAEEESMRDVFLPSEVETLVRGGVKDVLKLRDGEHLYIESREGELFPAATREIFRRQKEPVGKRQRRHTLPVSLEAGLAQEVAQICATAPPVLRLLRDIKAPPPPDPTEVEPEVQVLQDVRKSRPRRPGRSGRGSKENRAPDAKPDVESKTTANGVEPKRETPRLSRLDRYKLQFQSFEEKYNDRNSGNRLTLVGAFDEDEVEELDFSEPAEIRYIEARVSLERRAVISSDGTADANGFHSADGSPPPQSFQELKSFIGAKLDLGKALEFQSGGRLQAGGNRSTSDRGDEVSAESVVRDRTVESGEMASDENTGTSPDSGGTLGGGGRQEIERVNGFVGEPLEGAAAINPDRVLAADTSETLSDVRDAKKKFSSWQSVENLDAVEEVEHREMAESGEEPETADRRTELSNTLAAASATEVRDANACIRTVGEDRSTSPSNGVFLQGGPSESPPGRAVTVETGEDKTGRPTSSAVNDEIRGFAKVTLEERAVQVRDSVKRADVKVRAETEEKVNERIEKPSRVSEVEGDLAEDESHPRPDLASCDRGPKGEENRIPPLEGGEEASERLEEAIVRNRNEEPFSVDGRDETPGFGEDSEAFGDVNVGITERRETSGSGFLPNRDIERAGHVPCGDTLGPFEDRFDGVSTRGGVTVEDHSRDENLFSNDPVDGRSCRSVSGLGNSVVKDETTPDRNDGPSPSVVGVEAGPSSSVVDRSDSLSGRVGGRGARSAAPVENEAIDGRPREPPGFPFPPITGDLERRLPVTCGLLRGEKSSRPPSGTRATTSLCGAKKDAKWNESCLQGPDVYLAIMDFRPMETDEEAVAMREGQRVEILDASKPRRWKVRVLSTDEDPAREGWVPACYLERRRSTICDAAYLLDEPELPVDPRELEAVQNREAIVKELVETEEDFAKDMAFVVENYFRRMEEDPRLPKEFRDRKGSIFGNFKDISDFHNNVLMEGIHYHAKEPTKLGKTFLRLERDFDMHANYCWNEARAQRLLKEGPLREYFDEHSRKIEDDKLLSDHLKLPIQRLNDYQLLLKELIKYSSRLDEDTSDLQKALDFIHGINKRTRDLQCVQAMQGCKGDLLKIGKIVRQEIFDVVEEGGGASERHVFLFKGRLFVTEKRSTAGKETYHVTHLFRLQDVELLENVESDPSAIQFRSRKKSRPGFPLTLRARSAEQKGQWCRDIAASQGAEDLGDLEPSLDPPPELKHKATEEPEDRETKRTRVEEDTGGQGKPAPVARREKKKSPPQTPPAEAGDRAPELPRKDPAPQTPVREVVRQESLEKKEEPKQKEADGRAPASKDKKREKAKGREEKAGSQEAEKRKELDSMDKPRFSKTLRGVTCALGDTALLECETDGSPVPGVTWLKDNQKIAKSDRVRTSSQGQRHTLTLDEATAEDGGLYTVVASNSKGTASCSAPLNLKIPLLGVPKDDSRPTTPGGTVLPHAPVFKVKLNKETQLLEGTSVRFELVVRGNPEPKVQFLKDGKELKVDDRVRVSYESKEVFELILDHVGPKDAGTYSCVATNSQGEDKTVGNLSVVKNKDVFKGLEDSLKEEREPSPRPRTPKFKWFKDGQYFEANERFQVIFNEEEDSLALMFQHVTPEDAGLYTCVASTSTGSKIACSAELTVQGVIRQVEAPGIKAQLSDVEATEGGSAMLELKITGFPKPKVTWYHKNKEVSTGGRFRFLFADEESFTLVIKNVKKDDSGKYSVKAVNEMGEAESSCTLSVKSAPSFVKGLKDMSVMAEETIVFEAQIDGNPAPEVKWYKDGQQLTPSDRIKISNEGGKPSLKILKAKPTDSGSYSCVLTNSIGNQAEFSNVVVKASPTFSKGMENVEGLEGDTLRFTVEVNGNPKPTLKWTKDGKELTVDGKHIKVVEEASNSYTLVIDKAVLSDVGVYTCEIRNEHGLKASSGNLNLKTKPDFIKKLSDSECKEGESISLSTMVKGYPCPSIKWFQGETELMEDKTHAIVSEKDSGNYSLKIKKVDRKMSGSYTCKATNEMGEASTTGTLTVIVTKKKPEMDQQLKPTQLVEGKPGKLVAKVSGEPKPKIQWLKDGKPLPRDGRFSTEESDDGTVTLLIDKVTPDDAGLYSILAINEDGEARSEAPVTTIPAGRKPEFVKELEKQDLMEGQPLKLQAKVVGKPTSIKWQKDGEDISASNGIKMIEEADGTVMLLMDNVSEKDAGKYTVIASNAEGKTRSTALVQVLAVKKPEIVSSLEPLTLNDGETGHLKIKVTGQPKPTVKWLKDGKELKPSNRVESVEEPDGTISLAIKNARPEDAGNYTFVAQNSKGEVKSSAPVTVTQAPTFQKPLGPVSVVEGFPAKLEAKLGGSPPPEISWLKDGKPITPDGTHLKEMTSPDGTVALLLDASNLEDAGRYSLVAKNPLGEDTSSGTLDVTGKEAYGIPKAAPCVVTPLGNLCVKEGESIRFETEVTGNPLPDIGWTMNDKVLEPSDNTLMTFDGKKAILEIKRSSPNDIGVYKCKLTNPLGEARTEGSVAVQEKSAPHFIQRLTDFSGFINQPMKLTCKLTGYPEPEVDWYFNGNLLSSNNPRYNFTHFGDTHSFTITGAQPEDTGVYECRATNPIGEDYTRAAVNISDKVEKGEPPMFLKKIGDNEVMEGMTAKFTACITGVPTPNVSWVKEGNPLEPSNRHKMELESTGILRLIIREVESSDYGNYSVTVSNIHGSATSSAKLCPDSLDDKYITPIGDQFIDFDKFRKTGAPVPLPEKPRIIRMDDNSLTLEWKPSVPNAPRMPVTYQLEMASHPEGEWTPYKIGVKDTLCDVRDLRPGSDYKFRIRVENKHGVSEPSPYTIAYRSKIYEPPKPQDFLPKDYEMEHPPLQKYAAPPKFVRKEDDSMYGVRGQPVTIEFWVYGHPEPQVTWFKGESQIGKDKYTFMQDRNGKLCVFIDCMSDDHVGTYTCVAVNDEGEASMKIKLLIAESPIFIQKLDETTSMSRRTGRMQCRVIGLPYPKIKWFRDWHPLYESERTKILWEEPDKCTLFISNLITRDNALYSCTATNIAGTATTSASLNVEDAEEILDAKTYCRPTPVKSRTKPFEDFYDIGDELGRGTQGITYHAVKRETGDVYAAKSMHGRDKLKDFMKNELEIMNQMCHPKLVRLRDVFEAKDSMTLVTDICGGGELLGNILKRGGASEREIADYVKQILEGLEYMHSRYIGHLGLTVGDVMVSRVNSYDIKFGDFGLAARLLPGKDFFLEYGHPEFVAPEIANRQPATLLADMWSIGVITYLLLSGISPFLGENDRETLTRVQQGKINFVEDAFIGVSDDAKDFMSKLLVFEPKSRMDVKTALNHRWLKYYVDKPLESEKKLNNVDRLKEYQKKWKEWYDNASCKRYYRRRTLESCFHHPSRMIYPPGECYTPPSTPEPNLDRSRVKPSQFDDITFKQKINREEIDFRSESSYQNGPDTYLLQLRDTDFPLRLRQYLRVGASTSPSLAANLRDAHWGDSTLVIRERRKFVDVMDEEIDDEKKGLIPTSVPRRIYHEVGTLGFAHEQMELLKKEVWKDRGSREVEIGMAPYFREKMRNMSMKEGDEIVFRCYAIGRPKVDYAWFRNDGILLESSRIVVKELKDGHCELRINPSRAYDAGVYKCVARNMHGTSCCRARLRLGSKPGRPEAPVLKACSDTEIYITWAVPRDEGQSTTLGYTLEYKRADAEEWNVICDNCEHEYFVVRNLSPSTFYQFRVKAFNKFGWGEPGFPTAPISTKEEGAPKVKTSPRRKYQQEFTERTPDYELKEIELPELDYSQETNPVPIVEGDTLDLYRIVSEMDRGRFSVVLNVWVKESNTSSIAKVIQTTEYGDGKHEYEIMKSLCHEKIVMLCSASFKADKTVLVMEKLSGVDVMSYLALRHDYSEELVVTIIKQVLEALQYLHFREICYLELQPDNVVMVNLRDVDIKLVDFGSARFIPKAGAKLKTRLKGCTEYLAPEILKDEEVSSLTDVWCVGVLTYILLSGMSPFLGKDEEETRDNVTYVRYHFDSLHPDATSEVTRFLLNIFKQCPIKRLTIDECLEHKWLSCNEYMIMKRESARLLPDKLAEFAKKFHTQRYEAMDPEMLTSLNMSSTKQELIIDF